MTVFHKEDRAVQECGERPPWCLSHKAVSFSYSEVHSYPRKLPSPREEMAAYVRLRDQAGTTTALIHERSLPCWYKKTLASRVLVRETVSEFLSGVSWRKGLTTEIFDLNTILKMLM